MKSIPLSTFCATIRLALQGLLPALEGAKVSREDPWGNLRLNGDFMGLSGDLMGFNMGCDFMVISWD